MAVLEPVLLGWHLVAPRRKAQAPTPAPQATGSE
jgi:hypothetical protein